MGSALHVVASAARRGAELFAVDLASALVDERWSGEVVAVQRGPHAGLAVDVLGDRWPSLAAVAKLRQRLTGFDVVIAHGSSALPAVAMATAGLRIPFIYRNIGDPSYWATTRLAAWRVGAMLRRAAGVAALWDGAGSELTRRYRLDPARVRTIPNGVDPDRFVARSPESRLVARASIGTEPPIIVFVGALSPEKNVGAAIAAVATMPTASLVVIGDGPDRVALETAARKEAPGRVRFVGSVDDVRPLVAAADAMVLTSRSEGIPAALIEAAMLGVPAVATDVGGVSSVILPGTTGFLVPIDTPAAEIGCRLQAAVADRERLGVAARDHATRHFSLTAVAAAWAALLKDVVRKG